MDNKRDQKAGRPNGRPREKGTRTKSKPRDDKRGKDFEKKPIVGGKFRHTYSKERKPKDESVAEESVKDVPEEAPAPEPRAKPESSENTAEREAKRELTRKMMLEAVQSATQSLKDGKTVLIVAPRAAVSKGWMNYWGRKSAIDLENRWFGYQGKGALDDKQKKLLESKKLLFGPSLQDSTMKELNKNGVEVYTFVVSSKFLEHSGIPAELKSQSEHDRHVISRQINAGLLAGMIDGTHESMKELFDTVIESEANSVVAVAPTSEVKSIISGMGQEIDVDDAVVPLNPKDIKRANVSDQSGEVKPSIVEVGLANNVELM